MIVVSSVEQLQALVADTRTGTRKPLLVFFSASWCQPCKQFRPHVEEVTHALLNLRTVYYDLDLGAPGEPFPAIKGVPVLMLVRRGKVVKTSAGAMAQTLLAGWIRNALRSTGGRKAAT